MRTTAWFVACFSLLVAGTVSAQVGQVARAVFLAAAGLVSTDATGHVGRLAPTVFLAAAAFDWTSTSVNLATGPAAREGNPALAWLNWPASGSDHRAGRDSRRRRALAVVACMGRQHPRVATVGLYLAAGFRVALAARNVSRYRHAILGR